MTDSHVPLLTLADLRVSCGLLVAVANRVFNSTLGLAVPNAACQALQDLNSRSLAVTELLARHDDGSAKAYNALQADLESAQCAATTAGAPQGKTLAHRIQWLQDLARARHGEIEHLKKQLASNAEALATAHLAKQTASDQLHDVKTAAAEVERQNDRLREDLKTHREAVGCMAAVLALHR